MSAALAVTQGNFEAEVLEASKRTPVLIDFWAPWCGPCRQLMPILDRVAADHDGRVKLVKINTDDEMALAGAFGIRSLPTVVLMKDGQVVDGFMGAQPESVVRALLARHLGAEPVADDEAAAELAAADLDLDELIVGLEQQLQATPEKEELRVELADAYARAGDAEAAEAALAQLKEQAEGDGAKRVRARLQFIALLAGAPSAVELEQAIARDPADLAARHLLGVRFLLGGQPAAAFDQFLHLLKSSRSFGDDLGRRSLVDGFRLVDDPDLVGSYRRKMTSLLF